MKHPEATTSPLKIDLEATNALVDRLTQKGAGKKVADVMPTPVGWKILIAMPDFEKKVGSIHVPDSVIDNHGAAFVVGLVMRVGPLAFADREKFPTGSWCKEGDFIIINKYSGTRFKIEGHEFRLINDDIIEAVVEDPRKIERA
jgi:co-chaperonin GroES (HSP10)